MSSVTVFTAMLGAAALVVLPIAAQGDLQVPDAPRASIATSQILDYSKKAEQVQPASIRKHVYGVHMRFMMLVLADDHPDTEPDDSDVQLWVDELDAAGSRLDGDILDPSTATVVRVRNGERLITSGPTPGATESLWGFDLLEATDLDEAIDIAAKHPMARNGRLELRPIPDE